MKRRAAARVRELTRENARLRAEVERLARTSELAYRDALTGLRNRRYLEERLAEELASARRHGRCGSLVLVDVDDFKRVNDEHGHLAGDRLLCWLGAFLQEHLRTEDVVCRLGGDEFVLLLPGTDAAGARQTLDRLREQLGLASRWHGGAIGLSLGAASWPAAGDQPEPLLQRADEAMYLDKALRKAAASGVPRAA